MASRHKSTELRKQGRLSFIAFIFGVSFVLSSAGVAAKINAESSDTATEIEHLLQFIQNTSCDYERNGKKYSGKEALKHILKKYDYYEDEIDSAERFIALSASKSTVSGKSYRIHCPDKPVVNSRVWLLEELRIYRGL